MARSAAWVALLSPAGRPLPLAVQRRRSSHLQPLRHDLRLLTSQISDHEVHFALIGKAQKVVRAWRVRSRTSLALARASAAFVDDDLVVVLDVLQRGKPFRWEHVVLRLGPTGRATRQLALDARAVWDPDGSLAGTTLRVAPDGRLYQLRTNPKTGISVARYALGQR